MLRVPLAPALALALSLAVTGCAPAASTSPAPSDSSPSDSSPAASAPAASAPAASAPAASAPQPAPATVRLALDWTPNTNHTGFFVAQQRGWYRDAGIELQVLPYNNAPPETIVSAGQAECGISFEDSLTFAVAAGANVTSVMAILQHAAQELAVLASSEIRRPRDLDGKTYAGFGYPNEEPTVRAVIRADGGSGTLTVATLNGAAYDALYSRQADAVITFTAWEGVEARERGIELRYFPFTDYGFPDFYQVVLACNRDWLAANPDVATRFVRATVRGFEVAATAPDEAAKDLISANPGVFDANPTLPLDSARFLAEGDFYVDADGAVGTQTLERWTAYPRFLYEQGLLTGPDGKPLATEPDYAALFTNDFLP